MGVWRLLPIQYFTFWLALSFWPGIQCHGGETCSDLRAERQKPTNSSHIWATFNQWDIRTVRTPCECCVGVELPWNFLNLWASDINGTRLSVVHSMACNLINLYIIRFGFKFPTSRYVFHCSNYSLSGVMSEILSGGHFLTLQTREKKNCPRLEFCKRQ